MGTTVLHRAGWLLFQGRKRCQGKLCEIARKSSSELILLVSLDTFICFHVAVAVYALRGGVSQARAPSSGV